MLEAALHRNCGPWGVLGGRQCSGVSGTSASLGPNASCPFSQLLVRAPIPFCREPRGIAERKNVHRRNGSRVRAEAGPGDLHVREPVFTYHDAILRDQTGQTEVAWRLSALDVWRYPCSRITFH